MLLYVYSVSSLKKKQMKKIVLALCLPVMLGACAVPLKSHEMMPPFDFYDTVQSEKYSDSIFIRNVSVSKGVGGDTPITPDEYKATLTSALRQANLYSPQDTAKYSLDANITKMKKPFMGFNMTVTVATEYKILEVSNEMVIFEEKISVPCTKTIGDSFDSMIRLRLASGCAVGENITHFIKVISQN